MSSSSDSGVSARRAATRERLIKGAIVVFARQGIRGASVEQICEEAGFTRGAFYSNFDSKDELISALLEWYIEEIRRTFLRTLENAREWDESDMSAVVQTAADLFVASQPNSPDLVLTLADLRLEAARSTQVREAMEKVTIPMKANFRDLLVDALAEVGLRFIGSAPTTFAMYEAVYDTFMLEAATNGTPTNSPELANQLALLLSALTEPVETDA